MSCVDARDLLIDIPVTAVAGQTVIVPLDLPRDGTVLRLRVVPTFAAAATGTAANGLTVRLVNGAGATVGTVTNLTTTTSGYNPAALSSAMTAYEPVVLDFERRPGINYTLINQGNRGEVPKAVEFNKAVRPFASDKQGRIEVQAGSSVSGPLTVTLEVREG